MSNESPKSSGSRKEKQPVFVSAWTGEAYRDETILELKQPLEKILESLRDDVEHARITALIGDDTSGRVPTLILRGALSEIYALKNEKTPTTLFINGPGGGRPEDSIKDEERITEIAEYLRKRIDSKDLTLDPEKKILFVTETIKSGNSLKPVLEACKRIGLPVEVVSVGIESEKTIEQIQKELGVPVHAGMTGTPKIYRAKAYSGVTKPEPDPSTMFDRPIPASLDIELFAKPYVQGVPKHDKEGTQDFINAVREQGNMLSKELAEKFTASTNQV